MDHVSDAAGMSLRLHTPRIPLNNPTSLRALEVVTGSGSSWAYDRGHKLEASSV